MLYSDDAKDDATAPPKEFGQLDISQSHIWSEIVKCQQEIKLLQKRNQKKDSEKAFEKSYTRTVSIMLITYGTLLLYMHLIGIDRPAINAIVPAVGFNLSTWSLSYIKPVWKYARQIMSCQNENKQYHESNLCSESGDADLV